MDISNIYKLLTESLSIEDMLLLALIIFLILDNKCDKIFIMILLFIFIAGLNQDITSTFFKNGGIDLSKILEGILKQNH